MVNVGKQLKKAREVLKVTLKEAEEVTKIREDFLAAFEEGEPNIPLPEVYQRGFLRIYAEFLRLNADTLLAQWENGEEKQEREPKVAAAKAEMEEASSVTMEIWEETEEEDGEMEKSSPKVSPLVAFYGGLRKRIANRQWKIVVGCILGIMLCGLIIWKVLPKNPNSLEELLDRDPMEVISVEDVPAKRITLVASDGVQVLVRDKTTKEKLFSGLLKKGESRSIDYYDNLQISFSEGSVLNVHKSDGENIKPQKNGIGWMEVSY
ncbi:MAG: helix-turn-helix domain-containing protein [Puniceicoccales bacterium]|nr:helix-turn-helix domain-containing protein [Puniceicoccales bacterium]